MEKADLRWGIERRLEFIECRLFWAGRVNRGMRGGMAKMPVRKAQVHHPLNRLGLNVDLMSREVQDQQVVLLIAAELGDRTANEILDPRWCA